MQEFRVLPPQSPKFLHPLCVLLVSFQSRFLLVTSMLLISCKCASQDHVLSLLSMLPKHTSHVHFSILRLKCVFHSSQLRFLPLVVSKIWWQLRHIWSDLDDRILLGPFKIITSSQLSVCPSQPVVYLSTAWLVYLYCHRCRANLLAFEQWPTA
jgi:hypothetical protein